jgi:hypothetical protein
LKVKEVSTMVKTEDIRIVGALADGFDPLSGQKLKGTPYDHIEVCRDLQHVLREISRLGPKVDTDLDEDSHRLYHILRDWREKKALAIKKPHYYVAHDVALIGIACQKPKTLAGL